MDELLSYANLPFATLNYGMRESVCVEEVIKDDTHVEDIFVTLFHSLIG